jgi:hypothetical protein
MFDALIVRVETAAASTYWKRDRAPTSRAQFGSIVSRQIRTAPTLSTEVIVGIKVVPKAKSL